CVPSARTCCCTRPPRCSRNRLRQPLRCPTRCRPCRTPPWRCTRSCSMTSAKPSADTATGTGTPPVQGWRRAPHWVLAFVALWPAPGYAEGVMVLGALAAIVLLLKARFRGGSRLLSAPAWALTSVLFFAYWTPQLVSSFDAIDHGRAFREALVDL